MNSLEAILDRVSSEHSAHWTAEDRSLLLRVAERAMSVSNGNLAGPDDRDLNQLLSQLAGIQAAEAHVVKAVLSNTIRGWANAALSAIGLPPLVSH